MYCYRFGGTVNLLLRCAKRDRYLQRNSSLHPLAKPACFRHTRPFGYESIRCTRPPLASPQNSSKHSYWNPTGIPADVIGRLPAPSNPTPPRWPTMPNQKPCSFEGDQRLSNRCGCFQNDNGLNPPRNDESPSRYRSPQNGRLPNESFVARERLNDARRIA